MSGVYDIYALVLQACLEAGILHPLLTICKETSKLAKSALYSHITLPDDVPTPVRLQNLLETLAGNRQVARLVLGLTMSQNFLESGNQMRSDTQQYADAMPIFLGLCHNLTSLSLKAEVLDMNIDLEDFSEMEELRSLTLSTLFPYYRPPQEELSFELQNSNIQFLELDWNIDVYQLAFCLQNVREIRYISRFSPDTGLDQVEARNFAAMANFMGGPFLGSLQAIHIPISARNYFREASSRIPGLSIHYLRGPSRTTSRITTGSRMPRPRDPVA